MTTHCITSNDSQIMDLCFGKTNKVSLVYVTETEFTIRKTSNSHDELH